MLRTRLPTQQFCINISALNMNIQYQLQSKHIIKMIERVSELPTSQIEKECQLRQEPIGPVQFNIATLLNDQYTRREVLLRMRQAVADPQVRKLIDQCLKAGQTQVEKVKNKDRLTLHAKEKRLEKEINQIIEKTEKVRRQNEMLENLCKEAKSKDISELEGKKQQLLRSYDDNTFKYTNIKKAIENIKKEFILKHVEPKAKTKMADLLKTKGIKTKQLSDLQNKLEQKKRKLKGYQNHLIGLNVVIEKRNMKNYKPGVIQVTECTRIIPAQQMQQKISYVGPVSKNLYTRYIALIIAVGIVWSLILASKAYSTVN